MQGIIYKCECESGVYIGQTINSLEKRIYSHCYSSLNSTKNESRFNKFYDALRKHDHNTLRWEVIDSIQENDSVKIFYILDALEKFWIDHYDSINSGLNVFYGSPRKMKKVDFRLFGKDNPAYVEINIDENEYLKKANEGMNRKQLADHFGVPECHIKIWRNRMILSDCKYKEIFMKLDQKRRNTSAFKRRAILKYSDHIEDIKKMLSEGFSMHSISKKLNVPFSSMRRIIHRDLKVK